jgi:radical SAM/Cys-rich protein
MGIALVNVQGHAEGSGQGQTRPPDGVEPFGQRLLREGLSLVRGTCTTLQVNVGLACNQACRHCHLEAGPHRPESMSRETADQVVAYARRGRFRVIDITGGAPELNPHLPWLVASLAPLSARLMVRSNLTALDEAHRETLATLLADAGVVVVASLPSLNAAQADAQRGQGSLERSLAVLRRLNALGYGRPGSGLELNLAVNPVGAFLPAPQAQAEAQYRRRLAEGWGIRFNRLFTLHNAPLGRFRAWLADSGNLIPYMRKLAAGFNPCAVASLMCRELVSVSWAGYLHDCDFNLARGLPLGGRTTHVSQAWGAPAAGAGISVADHCYACTAGAGFT